ncbi:MAG: sigma 54-interacting transcriptional regulator [Planctomycetes bacterium]|nr:sigma 54-interacting transcriptional regulator [Planctomycetota bacterium]
MHAPEQVEAILDTVGDGVVSVDAGQRIRLVNREVERVFGYDRGELLGESVHVLMPKPWQGRHDRAFRRRLLAPDDVDTQRYRLVQGQRRDGSTFPLEVRFTTVVADGERLFVASVRDVTDREQQRAEIARLTAELSRERDYLREEVKQAGGFGEIVGASSAIGVTMREVAAVADTDATVLIEGESGVGKELVARAVHERSARSAAAMVRVNCASVPESLFESEFFGHKKGAFTGAIADRVGRFQLADKGTIFLDEIGEVPLALQSKLLRVLQERQFERLGDERTTTVDVRVIAATNRDLRQEVAAGRFREDLYFRLGVFPIRVPPLRDRGDDVSLLARHFVERSAVRLAVARPEVGAGVDEVLGAYDWPGNVRELQNVIERAVILARAGSVEPWMLQVGGPSQPSLPQRQRAAPARRSLDRDAIEAALARHHGVVKRAASELGLSRQSLYRRMRKFGIRDV